MSSIEKFGKDLVKYEAELRPAAFNLTRNKEEMEDLVQDTFYRALTNSDKFENGTNIKAWLFTIMRNNFINNYHKKKRTETLALKTDTNNSRLSDRNESRRAFIADDINKAMKEVSGDFTEAFIMYHEGFHYNEISERLNVPLGTIKSRIFSARKGLQTKLTELGVVNASYEI